jgi:hypothetical protein
MRYFVLSALLVLAVLVLRQKPEKAQEQDLPTSAGVTQSVQSTATGASKHNWAKSALDRTQDVKQQVKRERESNELR